MMRAWLVGDVLGGEEAEDFAVGFVAVVVLEDFGVDGGAVFFAEMEGEGDLSVDGAGALDEASGEAYDDERGAGGGFEGVGFGGG